MSSPHLYRLETASEQDKTLLQGLSRRVVLNSLCFSTLPLIFTLNNCYSSSATVFDSLGSTATLHSSDQHVRQCLPDDAVGQRHLDTIFNLDGHR